MAQRRIEQGRAYTSKFRSGTGGISIPTPAVPRIGTSRAGAPRSNFIPKDLSGYQIGQSALNFLSAVTSYYQTEKDKVKDQQEKSKVWNTVTQINDDFKTWEENNLLNKTGSNAVGIVDELQDKKDELLAGYMKGYDDPKSMEDVEAYFTRKYMESVSWAHDYELSQAEQTKKIQQEGVIDNNSEKILELNVGDTGSIEQIVDETVNEWEYLEVPRGSSLPTEQREQMQRTIMESFLFKAMKQWADENPSKAVQLWKGRPTYFKKHLTKTYGEMAGIMEQRTDDAIKDDAYNLALAKSRDENGNLDFYSAADDVLTKEFIDTNMGGNSALAMEVSNRLITTASAHESAVARAHEKVVNVELDKIYLKNKRDDGTFNATQAGTDLDVLVRKGTITSMEAIKAKTAMGRDFFTPADASHVYQMIDDRTKTGQFMTDTEIRVALGGMAPEQSFIAYRDRAKKGYEKTHGIKSMLDIASSRFNDFANSQRSVVKRKKIRAQQEEFDTMMRMYMNEHDLNIYSTELYDYSTKLLQKVLRDDNDTPDDFTDDKYEPYKGGLFNWGKDVGFRYEFEMERIGAEKAAKAKSDKVKIEQGTMVRQSIYSPPADEIDETNVAPETKALLDEAGLPYTKINIQEAEKLLAEEKQAGGQ